MSEEGFTYILEEGDLDEMTFWAMVGKGAVAINEIAGLVACM